MFQKFRRVLLFPMIMSACFLSGCLAATAIEVAAETVEAGVEVTGAVVGASVDAVTTSKDEREAKKKKKDRN